MEMSQGNAIQKAPETLADTIRKKISEPAQKAESLSSPSIFRVPEHLRKLKESAYTPRLVSIGPLHSKDEHLLKSPVQQYIKMSYVNNLFCRVTNWKEDLMLVELTKCLEAMKQCLDDARKCYAEDVDDTLDEEMLLIDGCFILELLYRWCLRGIMAKMKPDGEESNKSSTKMPRDPIFDGNLTSITVEQDLLLLENQIPFFVLEILFSLTVDHIPDDPHQLASLKLNDYVSFYFGHKITPEGNGTKSSTTTSCSPSWCGLSSSCRSATECVLSVFGNTTNPEETSPPKESRKDNYLHILHKLYRDNYPPPSTKEDQIDCMPSASDLDYAGVKFVASTSQDLFEVKFTEPQGPFRWCRRARFEIPTLAIYDGFEPFLRNLIAFEQCWPNASLFFTSYALLMDMLVNSEKDVAVLEKAGLIRNYLGASEDVSDLFNKLCKEVVLGKFFAGACKDAAKYSERCWPKAMMHLRRKYFASPWSFVAFCVAFVVFGMSITQFVRNLLK